MSFKIKPNEPCPCQSGRKYKKCCRKKVIRDLKKTEPIRMFEHARICKGMYDNFLPVVSKHIVKQNKQPYSLIAYHPVHCIHFTADKKYKLCVKNNYLVISPNINMADWADQIKQATVEKQIQLHVDRFEKWNVSIYDSQCKR